MATPNFCSWESIRVRVAARLRVPASQLPADWDIICSDAARQAAAELRRLFIQKSYSVERLAEWDDLLTYSQQLGVYFAFVDGTALCDYDLKSVEHLDCRKEIAAAASLIIGGKAVAPQPGESEVGGVSSGTLDALGDVLHDARRRHLFD